MADPVIFSSDFLAVQANPAFRASRGTQLPALVMQRLQTGQPWGAGALQPIPCPVGTRYVKPPPITNAAAARAAAKRAEATRALFRTFPGRQAQAKVGMVPMPGTNAVARIPWQISGLGTDAADPLLMMAQAIATVQASIPVLQQKCDDLPFWSNVMADRDVKAQCANSVAQSKKILAQLQDSLARYRSTPPTPQQVTSFLSLAQAASDTSVWNANAKLFDTSNLLATVAKDSAKDAVDYAGKVVDTAGAGVNKVASTLVKSLIGPVAVVGVLAVGLLWLAGKSGARIDTKFVKVNA